MRLGQEINMKLVTAVIKPFKLDEVHEIAEEIEHIENSKFFNRMREILGDTSIDPHGSIIPDYDY